MREFKLQDAIEKYGSTKHYDDEYENEAVDEVLDESIDKEIILEAQEKIKELKGEFAVATPDVTKLSAKDEIVLYNDGGNEVGRVPVTDMIASYEQGKPVGQAEKFPAHTMAFAKVIKNIIDDKRSDVYRKFDITNSFDLDVKDRGGKKSVVVNPDKQKENVEKFFAEYFSEARYSKADMDYLRGRMGGMSDKISAIRVKYPDVIEVLEKNGFRTDILGGGMVALHSVKGAYKNIDRVIFYPNSDKIEALINEPRKNKEVTLEELKKLLGIK
jgi:hypothetical protein